MKKRDFRPIYKALCYVSIISLFIFKVELNHAQDEEKILIGHRVIMYSTILEKEMQLSVHVPANESLSERLSGLVYISDAF